MVPRNSFAAIEEGNCDDINELVGYGVIGESKFEYGEKSKINGNSITGSGALDRATLYWFDKGEWFDQLP